MAFASLIAANDRLIILDEDGVLHIAEVTPEAYREIVSAKVQRSAGGARFRGRNRTYWWTNPVLTNGLLFVRSDKGDLVCLDVTR